MRKLTNYRWVACVIVAAIAAAAQVGNPALYTPKFPGDPAHSDVEAGALGYMRTVMSAQRAYKKKHADYAASLPALVGSGSFTRRMSATDRGDYEVKFRSTGKNYSLSLVPKQFDAAHRAFFVDDTGVIRAEDDKPATVSSPPLPRR
jgi:hypothetical protein